MEQLLRFVLIMSCYIDNCYHNVPLISCQMAWAPGKGMKGREFKDFWDVDSGVSYIPLDRLSESTDLDLLEEGGMIDEDSLPQYFKGMCVMLICMNMT